MTARTSTVAASLLFALSACGAAERPAAACPPCAEAAARECPGSAAATPATAPDAPAPPGPSAYLARVMPDGQHSANVAAPIEGVVESLRAEVGDHVAANDVVGVVTPSGGGRQVQVRSPVAGVVVESAASLGAAVAPHGPPMFFVSDLAMVWVVAEVPQHELPRVTLGAPVTVEVAMYPNRVWQGRVARIHPAVDPATGMGTFVVALDNADGSLRPGSDARVRLAPPPSP